MRERDIEATTMVNSPSADDGITSWTLNLIGHCVPWSVPDKSKIANTVVSW